MRVQVCDEGQQADSMFFLTRGLLRATKKGSKESWILREGASFGEMAIIPYPPTSALARLRRDLAHICAGTWPTSAPGPGPHLRRDRLRRYLLGWKTSVVRNDPRAAGRSQSTVQCLDYCELMSLEKEVLCAAPHPHPQPPPPRSRFPDAGACSAPPDTVSRAARSACRLVSALLAHGAGRAGGARWRWRARR